MRLSASELARALGVSRQLVHVWQKSKTIGFPPPVAIEHRTLGRGTPVWDLDVVKAWRQTKLTSSSV